LLKNCEQFLSIFMISLEFILAKITDPLPTAASGGGRRGGGASLPLGRLGIPLELLCQAALAEN
jgi:hypothetical protein